MRRVDFMRKASTRDVEMCQGCDLCKMGRLPTFENEDEEREFWATHSPLDFPEEFEDVQVEVVDLRRRKTPISIRLDPLLKENIKKVASIKRIRYQTLIQSWIREKFEEEEKSLLRMAQRKRKAS
jgi:predicted DNA binding CopG/RHH family protein